MPFTHLNKKLLMNKCFKAQFNYCLLVWMSSNRKMSNDKINKLHDISLCLAEFGSKAAFEEVLGICNCVLLQNYSASCCQIV